MDDSLDSELVSSLRRSGTLGAAPVEVRTTHASWIFLCGGDVWKVKRPVSFGFLDFRTIEARRHCCDEEVRLNRRLAPEIYLGVEAVRRSAAGFTIGGEGRGDIVDWAVHMRRLPDEASAAALLARGELGREDLAALAERLAAFHRESPQAADAGAAEALRRNVEENFAEVEPFVGDLLDRETLEDARAFQQGWLSAHGDVLAARQVEGRSRDGHGDLRLEHVYFVPDGDRARRRPVVIDCIEFNDRFRHGDVAGDVAFLAMELEAERRPELAAGFLARYAEASDDLGLYAVLDFYLSYRAWVRGKVAALVARDPSTPVPLRRAKELEARRDFALARSYAGRPAAAPLVIAVGGLIGSGKSTLATALGHELSVPVVSSDRTRKVMAGLAPTERGAPDLYTEANRDRAYAELLRQGEIVSRSGRGVVLDATFAERRWRAAASARALAAGATFAFVEVTCADESVLRSRLRARRGAPSTSDATEAELAALSRRYERPDASEGRTLVRVDGSGAKGDTLRAALEGLRRAQILR